MIREKKVKIFCTYFLCTFFVHIHMFYVYSNVLYEPLQKPCSYLHHRLKVFLNLHFIGAFRVTFPFFENRWHESFCNAFMLDFSIAIYSALFPYAFIFAFSQTVISESSCADVHFALHFRLCKDYSRVYNEPLFQGFITSFSKF
jgi:hypothetical protein